LLAIGVIAALGMLAGTSTAAKHHRRRPGPVRTATATDTAVADAEVATATAKCPKGSRAISGGFTVQFDGYAGLVIWESRRVSNRGWRVSATKDGVPSRVLVAYAYCRKRFPKISTKFASRSIPATKNAEAQASAACPAGKTAISGGFLLPAPNLADPMPHFNLMRQSLRDAGQSWTATASNITGDPGQSVRSEVYCAKRPKLRHVSATAPLAHNAYESATVASANCRGARKTQSGGFTTANSAGAIAGIGMLTGFRRSGKKAWSLSTTTLSLTATDTMAVDGYCA
jgi:hypothetical protein